MSVIDKLASQLQRRDEVPNIELANQIVTQKNVKAVDELVSLLDHKDKNIQSDAIKVLDEVAKLKPELLKGHVESIIQLLTHKNNRLQWGAMAVLNAVASLDVKQMYKALPQVIACADKGSVITNDHCVGILLKLYAVKEYRKDVFDLYNERLLKSPTNQLPMYAEQGLPVLDSTHYKTFVNTLTLRLPEIEKDTKRKRVEKVIQKISKQK